MLFFLKCRVAVLESATLKGDFKERFSRTVDRLFAILRMALRHVWRERRDFYEETHA